MKYEYSKKFCKYAEQRKGEKGQRQLAGWVGLHIMWPNWTDYQPQSRKLRLHGWTLSCM